MRQRSLIALTLSLELGGLGLLAHDTSRPAHTLAILAAHALVCGLCALCLQRLLPPPLRRSPGLGWLCLFTLSLLLPGLGAVGLAFGLVAPLRWPQARRALPYIKVTAAPELPFRPTFVRESPIYGEGHLVGMLRHAARPDQRLRAVMATRQLSDQYAIPILSVALKDPIDDVRLLAYALLDRKERTLYSRIQQNKKQLEEGADGASLHRRLAQDYWELAYLGLARGDVLAHVLAEARHHAEAALQSLPENPATHLLLGRILLRQGHLQEARRAFEAARRTGMPEVAVMPQLAEVAFLERRFLDLRDYLAAVDEVVLGRPPLSLVAAYWLK